MHGILTSDIFLNENPLEQHLVWSVMTWKTLQLAKSSYSHWGYLNSPIMEK